MQREEENSGKKIEEECVERWGENNKKVITMNEQYFRKRQLVSKLEII